MPHARIVCHRIGGYRTAAVALSFGQEASGEFNEEELARAEAVAGMTVERCAPPRETKPAPRRRTKRASDEPAH